MNKIVQVSLFAIVIITGLVSASYVDAVHYPSTCHLKAKNPTDVIVVYNNKGLISDRRESYWSDSFWHAANIPAGKYRISLEGFDGYTGRTQTTGQKNERYYVKFYNGDTSLVATSGVSGDVPDGVEQAYWRGVVNNNITLSKSVAGIMLYHQIPYYNANPNSVTPVCMLLEDLNYTPPKSKINGSCGSSNGQTFDVKPTSDLCSSGSTTSISGDGPWSWTCVGSNGGSTASCNAKVTITPVCGSSNGQTFDTKPTSELCSIGSASSVSGNGPWNWTCTNDTHIATCTAQITTAPVCGSSDGQIFSAKPFTGFCSIGSASSVSGNGPWNWTCTNGTRFVACDAQYATTAIQIVKSAQDGKDTQTIEQDADATFTITVTNTGEENLKDVVITDVQASNCNKSASQTQKLYDGDLFDPNESFTYSCVDTGVNSAYTNIAVVTADATTSTITVTDDDDSYVKIKDKIYPVCGSSDKQAFSSKPTSELCSVGSASSISGNGPWSWTCTNDEQIINCSAQLTTNSEPKSEPTPKPAPQKDDKEDKDDSAVGNLVWNDQNKNCIQDAGEEGISGIKLKLYNGNHVKTDRTNSRGHYKFKNLKKGHYRVVVAQETIPDGCYQVCDPDGTKMDQKTNVKVKDGKYHRKADFGYYCPSTTPVVAQSSPRTGAGSVAGIGSFMAAALSAGFVYRRNTKK